MNKLEWSPTEIFEISGFEMETMMTILNNRLSTPEAQTIIREYETLKKLQDNITTNIDSGKVRVIDSQDVVNT